MKKIFWICLAYIAAIYFSICALVWFVQSLLSPIGFYRQITRASIDLRVVIVAYQSK